MLTIGYTLTAGTAPQQVSLSVGSGKIPLCANQQSKRSRPLNFQKEEEEYEKASCVGCNLYGRCIGLVCMWQQKQFRLDTSSDLRYFRYCDFIGGWASRRYHDIKQFCYHNDRFERKLFFYWIGEW